MAYQAVIAKIKKITPIPNTDFISTGNVLGNTVVVGRNTPEDELGIFFEVDGSLSLEFLKANDLIAYKDSEGNKKGGFFDENGRVRAQKFKGVKSEGFWCPLSFLSFVGSDLTLLKEHDMLDCLGGVVICTKYFTKATKQAGEKNQKKKKEEVKNKVLVFPKHFDTEQFRSNAWKFKKGELISITEKLHGTSQRFAYTEELHMYKKYTWKWFKQKYGFLPTKTWVHVVGTRNVTLKSIEDSKTKGYYDDESFRFKVIKDVEGKLKKHEILFFEVVGWIGETTSIMPAGSPKALKDKQFQKVYGETMHYSYGTVPGQCKAFVYRIAQMNEDGEILDLSWSAVKTRCEQLGLEYVPEVCESFIYDGNEEKLRELVESLTDGPCTIDPSHIREGVVVRQESFPIPFCLKSKSFVFKVMEGMLKDNENYVDLEESA